MSRHEWPYSPEHLPHLPLSMVRLWPAPFSHHQEELTSCVSDQDSLVVSHIWLKTEGDQAVSGGSKSVEQCSYILTLSGLCWRL